MVYKLTRCIKSVAHALLCLAPFCKLPLHLRFFTTDAHAIFQQLVSPTSDEPMQTGKRSHREIAGPSFLLPAISSTVTTIVDHGGVSGNTGLRRQSTRGVVGREGPIDVQDEEFRRGPDVWTKWKTLQASTNGISCTICGEAVDTTVWPPNFGSLCSPTNEV